MGQQQSNLNLNTKEILVDYGSLKSSSSSLSILNRHKAHSNLIMNETSLASFKSTSNNNNTNKNNKKLNKFLSLISNNTNNNDNNNKKNLITLRRDESKIKNRKSNKNKLITKSLIIFNNNNNNNQEQIESIEPNITTIDTINSSNTSNSDCSSNKSLNKRLNKLTINTSTPSTHSVFCSSTPLNNNNNNNHLITTSNYRNLSYLNGLSNLNSNEPENIRSMYVQSIDDDNYLDTIDVKLKKNSKNRFSLKSTNNKVLLFNSNISNDTPKELTNESNELSKDSGIISDIFGSMNNIKSRLSNAKTSLKNSFSVFSLKSTTGSSSKDNQLTITNNDLKSIKLKKKLKNYKHINNVESLINLDAGTTPTTINKTTKIDNYLLTSTSIKRRSSISSATPSSYISSSVYNSSESSALSSASQSICSTSQNSHLRRTTTFHSSNTRQNLENNSFNQLNKISSINTNNTNKLYTNRTILAQPTKLITTQSFDIPNTYEQRKNSNQTNLTQPHKHQKIIVQASTNDLLRCFTSFLTKKCSHLIKSDDYSLSIEINNSIRKCETRDIINWLRSADRALLLQGWQEIAFMNPVNVVFVYLLVRDSLRPNELSTVYDLQCNIMACLYLAFSYMGNEISYPLKPFLIEENRSIFWSRIVSLMSQLSGNMLRINRDPRFFTELFYELKSYSVQTCPLVDNIISTNNSTTNNNNNVKTVLNNGVHKSMTVNELSSNVKANLFNDIKSKKDFFCKNEDELNRMFLMNRNSCLSTFMTSKSKQNCSYLNYALTSKTSCEMKNANYLYGTNVDASKQIPAYCI